MGEEFTRTFQLISPALHHGKIILYDDFESHFKWITGGIGAYAAGVQNNAAYNGDYGLDLVTDVGSPPGATAKAERRIIATPKQRLQLALYFGFAATAPLAYALFQIQYDDASNTYRAAIRLNAYTGAIQYYGSDAAYHDISGISLTPYLLTFYRLKLHVDLRPTHLEYLYLSIGDQEANLSGIAIRTAATLHRQYLETYIKIETHTAASATHLYIDDVLLTQI